MSVERHGLNKGLRFVLDTGADVTFTTYRTDHPDGFAGTVNRAITARLLEVPVVVPPAPIPAIPPPPTW